MMPKPVLLVLAGAAFALTGFDVLSQPAQGARDEACIEAVSYLPLDPAQVGRDSLGMAALGTYERISPDGRFVLRSFSGAQLGQVGLIELPAEPSGRMTVRKTPLSNEAFPVQGSWRYLVDVDGSHYRFSDIVRQLQVARPLFKGGMKGFYAAASELDSARSPDTSLIWIRSMSWPQGGRAGQGTGPLQVRTLGLRDDARGVEVVHDSGPQFICRSREVIDGNVYTLPMLSVDGLAFSAIPINPRRGKPSMRVYGLAQEALDPDHPCDLRWDLQATPGKAVFGFTTDQPALLTYTDNASVYFVDPRPALKGQVFRIEDWRTQVLASAFPGLTRDGRIVFGATWKDCRPDGTCTGQAGYVVADPYQNPDYRQQLRHLGLQAPKTCISPADVLRERQRFATQHGLIP
ncbi:MAG: hypothetical protein Q8S71_06505 [Hydrogenophaga sp.]|nr:hypothetical protein [Hydrogenophaga sp.]MDP3883972.1 hypothetical protein [Hydrogenophaga sp.]MDZ4174373.1 hypothetical protein [Hydrogenophaga sp.]